MAKKKTQLPRTPRKAEREAAPAEKPGEYLRRLRERVAGHRGMKRFASLCGLPYTTYRNYEMGRNRLHFEAAKAIAAATGESPFTVVSSGEVTLDAPAVPKGEPRIREHVLHARGRPDLDSFSAKDISKDRKPVQVTPAEFGKGDHFLKGGDRLAFFARGQSMSPAIAEGDFLVFAVGAKPSPGDVVCASMGGKLTVKRFYPDPSRKIIGLQPENGAFAPWVVREDKPEAKKFKVEGVLVSLRRSFGRSKRQ